MAREAQEDTAPTSPCNLSHQEASVLAKVHHCASFSSKTQYT